MPWWRPAEPTSFTRDKQGSSMQGDLQQPVMSSRNRATGAPRREAGFLRIGPLLADRETMDSSAASAARVS